jgi:hypothetical protein
MYPLVLRRPPALYSRSCNRNKFPKRRSFWLVPLIVLHRFDPFLKCVCVLSRVKTDETEEEKNDELQEGGVRLNEQVDTKTRLTVENELRSAEQF